MHRVPSKRVKTSSEPRTAIRIARLATSEQNVRGPRLAVAAALTFATVRIGVLAAMAGALGMNFEAPFFAADGQGCWIAVGSIAAISITATVLARNRGCL